MGNGCQQRHLLATLGMALQVMGGAGVSQELNSNLAGFLLSRVCRQRRLFFSSCPRSDPYKQVLHRSKWGGPSGVGMYGATDAFL